MWTKMTCSAWQIYNPHYSWKDMTSLEKANVVSEQVSDMDAVQEPELIYLD